MDGYISEIRFFGANWAPKNWASCHGQLLSISQNEVIFSLIGTTYGGDGVTTFALPDLRGRVAVGAGQGNGLSYRDIGQTGGVEQVTLIPDQMPSHTHEASFSGSSNIPVNGTSGDEDQSNPGNAVLANTGNDRYASNPTSGASYGGNPVVVNGSVTIGNAGNSTSHANDQPYLVINPIICLSGIYPSRD